MAVSGSTDFRSDRDGIIDAAFELIGAKEADLTPDSSEVTTASKWLNRLIKGWQSHGTMLHVRTTGTVLLEKNKQSYLLGNTLITDGTYASRGTVIETTLDADEATGQTDLSVTSTAGIATGYYVGILLDDDSIHWALVNSFVADDTMTVGAGSALPSAASSGNAVYFYNNTMHQPVSVQQVILRDSSGRDVPLTPM